MEKQEKNEQKHEAHIKESTSINKNIQLSIKLPVIHPHEFKMKNTSYNFLVFLNANRIICLFKQKNKNVTKL